ncbi:putative sulfate exporter family transporter [Actinomadura sp. DC4]|uniref:YeiH family protein n=1 Tax=Actinomadura sp. DC4 TaxID=3055069 RepID=UPI0025AF2DFC|nr:putative sulfate exporter family transporter [Actinomadura sp. DC4]MDN3355031.1 putative sulfate exporter family transporter [Actinomadura sp. DC4]
MTTSTTRPHALPRPRTVAVRTGRRTARFRRARELGPGLAVCAAAVIVAWGVHRLAGAVPMLTAALLLGVVAVNTGVLPESTRAGSRYAATTLMRAGVVLLGLQVALRDIAGLGWQTIVMTVFVLLATLLGTRWLGRRMGLPPRMSLLVASGFAICGASAVAAVDGVLGSGEDAADHERDAATAVALVTLCGTLAIAVMPAAGHLLGLSPYDTGRWVGASVHDVGQVVATATVVGPAALVPAIAVKLVRVAMLAPVTAVTALRVRRTGTSARRPPVLPVFLVTFLAMVVIRSTGALPQGVLDGAGTAKDLLFAAALFGLGSAVRLRVLVRTGHRALLLGLTSWVLIAGISYAGVLLTR